MKSLFKNSIYNIIYKLFSLAFPLISSAYVSRILMPAGVGKVAYAQNIASYFITVAALGVSSYGIREIGKVQKNRGAYSKTFFELITITTMSTLICSIIYYGCVSVMPNFAQNRILYFVAGVQLFLTAINVDWFYQGMEEYRYITIRSFCIKLLTLICIFIFVRTKNDIVSYALLSGIALAGNNIINLWNLRRYVVKIPFKTLQIKKHLKPLIILLSTGLAVELYTKLDTTSLGLLVEDVNVGYYNYATKITSIVVNLAAAISTILLPRLSYYKENNQMSELRKTVERAQSAIFCISLPVAIGTFLLSDRLIVFLFGIAFAPASITVKILAALVVIKSLGNLYGVQVLVTFGAENLLFYTTLVGAFSNVLMNIILIPKLQQDGAAIASIISELLVCISQVILSRKFIRTRFDSRNIATVIISTTVMSITILILMKLITSNLLAISFSFIVGVLIYAFINIILKNQTAMFLLKKSKVILKR